MSQLRVGLIGASGETGGSIANGLIEAGNVSIVALARHASLQKPIYRQLQQAGAELRTVELPGPEEGLIQVMAGIDVLISAIDAGSQHLQIPLATAAKKAGVKRFVPCAFITVMPPEGRALLRDQKEQVYNHIKRLYLPYTIIDVGWWYQISLPRLESGKIDSSLAFPISLYGSGNVKSAMTDLRDIGKYVARIISDERTLDKYVLAYNETWTQNEIVQKLEELSGDKVERKVITEEQVIENQRAATAAYDADSKVMSNHVAKYMSDYARSIFCFGDNQPEYAKYLGYLSVKDLYPDLEYRTLESYIQEVLTGALPPVYSQNEAMASAHF